MTAPGKPLDLDGMEGMGGLIERLARHAGKRAPVQGLIGGIPWAMHLRAYDAYCKRCSPQPALIDLEGRGCRGGFGTEELDSFIPGWREELERPMPPELAKEAAEAVLALIQTQRELVGALKALREVVKDHPDFQGRQFVSLGIQVNNALHKALGEQPL